MAIRFIGRQKVHLLLSFLTFFFVSLTPAKEQLERKMQPFFRTNQDDKGCTYHIEDFCFARLCNGFISLGLNSNLDFTAIAEDTTDPTDSISNFKATIIINEDTLVNIGSYKNADIEMLKIPFFKQDETGQVCLAFSQKIRNTGKVRTYYWTQN